VQERKQPDGREDKEGSEGLAHPLVVLKYHKVEKVKGHEQVGDPPALDHFVVQHFPNQPGSKLTQAFAFV